MDNTPTLKNPKLDQFGDTSRLKGQIYNDLRFKDGEAVVTSRIRYIDFVEMTAQTQNTKYRLDFDENKQ